MSDSLDSLGMIFQTTADTSASSGLLDSLSGLFTSGDTQPGAPVQEGSTPIPAAEQAPPPVPSAEQTTGGIASTDAAESGGTLALNADGTGTTPIPGSAAASGATWFKSLSPGAQAILASGAAGGAAGILNGLAQKNILDEKKREINQSREDVQRKGQITAFSDGAIKPKGVIDGVRGA